MVEIAEDLKDRLSPEKTELQVAATYIPKEQLLKSYLHRQYGNAYDFDQIEKIENVF